MHEVVFLFVPFRRSIAFRKLHRHTNKSYFLYEQ